jgi:hypothetical protein
VNGTLRELSAIGHESGAREVVIEPEVSGEPELLHNAKTGAAHPADSAVAMADEEIPGAASAFGRGFDQVAQPTRLDRFAEGERVVDAPPRLAADSEERSPSETSMDETSMSQRSRAVSPRA